MEQVRQYSFIEWAFPADVSAICNPFTQVSLRATVTGPEGEKKLTGFYDGDGVFRLRFMPRATGEYSIETEASLPALDGLTRRFAAVPPASGEHGLVRPDGMHFRHEDGTPFIVMGTTAYVWHHRPAEVRAKTLDAFSAYGFNKIRMLFFPKHYTGNHGAIDVSYEPPCYPFEGSPRAFDFKRPNPEYFRQYEARLLELRARGIIADTILFHPYDFGHWDIDMGMDEDDALLYVRYIVARLSAFDNVWWSLANEYDIKNTRKRRGLMLGWDRRDWDVIGETIKARDPYAHPISCHNITFGRIYPDRPWMTHVSYQHPDTYSLMIQLQQVYRKPVIDDEYQYEGNIPDEWGNCSGALEVERHWRAAMAGGYATHGEVFLKGNNRDLFWAYGGEMIGESAKRLRFLKQILETVPFCEMERDYVNTDGCNYYALRRGTDEYLIFIRNAVPGKSLWVGAWNAGHEEVLYHATVYDVWNCEKLREEDVPASLRLPITEWTAVHLVRK